jgi:hypothetical protein
MMSESEASTMVEDDDEDGPRPRLRIIPNALKKVGQKSAEGTKHAIQATKDTAVAAAKATKDSATAVVKAVKFRKREVAIADEEESAEVEAERNISEGTPLLSTSSDSAVNDRAPSENYGDSVGDSVASSTARPIVVGPVLDFLTADATIFMIVSLSVAFGSTFRNWQSILDNQVPLLVAGSWVLLAYAAGQVFSVQQLKTSHCVLPPSRAASTVSEAENASWDSRHPSKVVDTRGALEKANSHRLFLNFVGPKQRKAIKFFTDDLEPAPKSRVRLPASLSPWTTLQPNREKVHRWERRTDPTKDPRKRGDLMRHLLRNQHFRRAMRHRPTEEKAPDVEAPSTTPISTDLGAFDLAKATADTLDDFVIEPILKLRGMDVFLTDQLEDQVASHPWLVSQGLRNVPTLVVNTLTQWGHILVYFEMPVWVQDWNNIVEDESDPDDVKALKRFLNGDSKYRNERLKVIPSVVEGPLAVKVLAPPKKEMLLNCALLPVSWQQYNPETSEGRKLCAALEVTLDCMSNRAMRGMAGIVKRNLKHLSIDMACVIGKPAGQEEDEDESEACLGLWRMDHIDVSACPGFPDRWANEASEKGQDPDVFRATKLVNMSDSEMQELSSRCINCDV